MFFQPPPAASKNWGEMFFYEKFKHIVDSTGDFVISKCCWWFPCVVASAVGSIFLFGGPETAAQGFTLASVALQPTLSPVSFASPPNMPQEMEEDGDEL